MGRVRFTPEQIIGKLREAELLLGQGTNIKYLDCGNPRCGFARIRCPDCRAEHLLMFSCKTRGFCPSCHAKRLEEWGESRDEPSARHSPVAYIHGRVRRKWTPG
jgi:ribosomal protein S27E